MVIHVVKQSRKIIKPATPTPQNLRHFKIGFIDELAPAMNVSVALFFPMINNDNNPKFVVQLENSLEKILKRFYPLVGRYVKETHTIDCSDQGVEFIHAKVNVKLQDFLDSKVNFKHVDEFLPSELGDADLITDPILAIQVTTFECGGIALGVSVSHRISDASTLSTFLIEWAAISREERKVEFTESCFNTSSLFPGRGLSSLEFGISRSSKRDDVVPCKNVIKKLTFSHSLISNLKEKAMINGRKEPPQWSKVQLVTAIILKALIGVDRALHGYPRDCILFQAINLREKTASKIPKDSCGNLCGMFATECGIIETTEGLADLLRDSIKNTISNYLKVSHDNEEGQMVLNSILRLSQIPQTTNLIYLSSWCKFPFYEVDFGFGKPIWVHPGGMILPVKNSANLMDGMGGNGVEAYVCLEAKDVPYFEEALEIKSVHG